MPEFYTSILEIPSLIRRKIWRKLSYDDQISVRQVCSAFQSEIDHDVGVTWTITEDLHNLNWFLQVRIRKCIIRDISKLKQKVSVVGDFLTEPFAVEQLHFLPITPILISDVLTIADACQNLTELAIHTYNKSMVLSGENQFVLDELLELVQGKTFLRKLHVVIYSHPKSSPRDTRKVFRNNYGGQKSFGNFKLQEIVFECPWIDSSLLDSWKSFLEYQKNLKVLVCNFGLLFWRFYSSTIASNSQTLEKIILRRITGVDPTLASYIPLDRRTDEDPFDWEIFSKCEELRYVKVIFDDMSLNHDPEIAEEELPPQHKIPSINLDLFPVENIEHFYCRNILITDTEKETFRQKTKETLRKFRERANIYVDEDETEFLGFNSAANNWYEFPAIPPSRNVIRRMMDRYLDRGEREDEPHGNSFLTGIFCAVVLWMALIISFVIGPFVMGLLVLAIILMSCGHN